MALTIYHNPRCGTSRKVLAILELTEQPVHIREYLKKPLSLEEVAQLAKITEGGASALLRTKEALCAELGITAQSPDDAIIAAIAEHPILLNRPAVAKAGGARVCRPAEIAQTWLEE